MTEVEATQRATQEKTARLKALRLATQAQLIAERTSKLKVRREGTSVQAD